MNHGLKDKKNIKSEESYIGTKILSLSFAYKAVSGV